MCPTIVCCQDGARMRVVRLSIRCGFMCFTMIGDLHSCMAIHRHITMQCTHASYTSIDIGTRIKEVRCVCPLPKLTIMRILLVPPVVSYKEGSATVVLATSQSDQCKSMNISRAGTINCFQGVQSACLDVA